MLCALLLTLNMYAVLWNEPRPATMPDWVWGPGGEARAPLPPFQFVSENFGGTNPKVNVRDARGALWVVKFGGEVHTETFSARLLNAVGYLAVPTHFVAAGTISGAHRLKRAKPFISRDGHFRNARFQLHDDTQLARAPQFQWSWIANPFLRSRELQGLKILMILL